MTSSHSEGPKSNEELLTGYGFCFAGNTNNAVAVRVGTGGGALGGLKEAALSAWGVTLSEPVAYLSAGGGGSEDMAGVNPPRGPAV